jgi:hypothetical protein
MLPAASFALAVATVWSGNFPATWCSSANMSCSSAGLITLMFNINGFGHMGKFNQV